MMNTKVMNIRNGVTLVELLVVIGVIVAVMAVSVPVVRLATDGNKIASAADQVRSFMVSVQGDSKLHGRSYAIFERNANAPNLCYRVFRGKPRPDYRGEDFTSYAISTGGEVVRVMVDQGGPVPIDINCNVFYLYNVDVAKVRPFQFLTLDGRPEKYEIIKARMIPATSGVVNQGVYRPVVKVFAKMNQVGPQTAQSPLVPVMGTSARLTRGPVSGYWDDWDEAFLQNPSPNDNDFWPNTVLWTNPGTNPSYDPSTDYPNANSVQYGFSVTQPPYVDEMNFLQLPDGMAIHLSGSGFDGEGNAVPSIAGTTGMPGTIVVSQFAWPSDGTDGLGVLENDPTTKAQLEAETVGLALPIDSVERTAYFPVVEFDGRGGIRRAFSCSRLMTSLLSLNSDIVRNTAFEPISPLFLQVGKDVDRPAAPLLVAPDDYWVKVDQMTGRVAVHKAEDGGTVRDSRMTSGGGISQ